MITKITNYKSNSINIKQNNKKLRMSNYAYPIQSAKLSFEGLDANKLGRRLPRNLGSEFKLKALRLVEESANFIKQGVRKLRGDELPFMEKPLIAPDTVLDLECLAENGDKTAKATYAAVKKIISQGVDISKTDDLFTSGGLFHTSAAKHLADTIMTRSQIPTSEMGHIYPDSGLELLNNISKHMSSGNLKEDIEYLTKIKNHVKFDTVADSIYNPENRGNTSYQILHHTEKYPTGVFYNQEQTLLANEKALFLEHPELIKNDPSALARHPELAHEFANDNINDLGMEHIEGIPHCSPLINVNKFVNNKVQAGTEHLTDGVHNIGAHFTDGAEQLVDGATSYFEDFEGRIGGRIQGGIEHISDKTQNLIEDFKPHFDLPEFKVPSFDFSFGEVFDDIRKMLDDLWDFLT